MAWHRLSHSLPDSDVVGRVGCSLVTHGPLPHPLDLIALVLGVLFALRQMDVTQRQATSFPQVAPADFARWWGKARGAYRLGSSACFGKIFVDIVAAYGMRHIVLPRAAYVTIGLSLDFTWLVLVVLAIWRTSRAHALARELGIEVRVKPASS